MLVDLRQTEPRELRKYMSRHGAARFERAHRGSRLATDTTEKDQDAA
ncbi:MAG: hypothetical protein WDO72_17360 [Pseudomonadota bacterium]